MRDLKRTACLRGGVPIPTYECKIMARWAPTGASRIGRCDATVDQCVVRRLRDDIVRARAGFVRQPPVHAARHFRPAVGGGSANFAGRPQIVYARSRYDIMKDGERSILWLVNVDGGEQRPLTSGGDRNETSPQWSPDGGRIAYVSNAEGSSEIHVRWLASGVDGVITHVEHGPSSLVWSPDGKWIAFMMFVSEPPDRKSTRLNSSHMSISYAVFCLKK